ncbi:hypothetical protein SALBM311S_03015 [Streptomyces alboniger]
MDDTVRAWTMIRPTTRASYRLRTTLSDEAISWSTDPTATRRSLCGRAIRQPRRTVCRTWHEGALDEPTLTGDITTPMARPASSHPERRKGACTYGEVFTTDGRIRSMHLVVMGDDRKFFPNYNAAPMIRTATLEKWPAIAAVLDPITRKLDNSVAQELNAKVDVDGEDPHQVALDWLKGEGFVKEG